ncbi:trypsin-like serine protease [Acaryochloris sp. 'Moss Beach']|uniref:trypsin-like serine peptidase n=1 Tax=Acaryochloris sp. 'Moss Beach' TaxID=2740837 RepID=UPI001F2275EE|nr:trypsin-like serine protease [Acaryochloris sp. 'Moss Beach']UJB71723.1 trypsin-like serine protease [Acaryochloris sp. 'Moss Beach']
MSETICNPNPAIPSSLHELDIPSITANPGSVSSQPYLSSEKLLVPNQSQLPDLINNSRSFTGIRPEYADSLLPESVIGNDDRVRILDTHNYPWRAICSLEIQGPRGFGMGTGWFIAPNLVVTAGHNIYHERRLGGWAETITVYPGRDGSHIPYPQGTSFNKPIRSSQFRVVRPWVDSKGENPDFDYGGIVLDQNAGNETGWFAVAAETNDNIAGSIVHMSGYPGDTKGGSGKYQLFGKDRVENSSITPTRFFYSADTYRGTSGAPVWLETSSGRFVVGIHTYGIRGGFTLNSATRINREVLQDLRSWM